MYFAMAEDNILPPIFKKLNSKTQVQEFALTIFAHLFYSLLFFLSSFQKYSSMLCFSIASALSRLRRIFILRYRAKRERTKRYFFKIKVYPLLPALFILVYVAVNVSVFIPIPPRLPRKTRSFYLRFAALLFH